MFIDRVTDLKNSLTSHIKGLMKGQTVFNLISPEALAEEGVERYNLPEVWNGEDGEADLYGIISVGCNDQELYVELIEKSRTRFDEEEESTFHINIEEVPVEVLAQVADILFNFKFNN